MDALDYVGVPCIEFFIARDGRLLVNEPAAMANLLGDLWEHGEPNWSAALQLPDVKLHLYGKSTPRPGRKMGHLTVLAPTAEEARARAIQARELLRT